MRARPTLNDVAVEAGVSRSTVSLVLRDAGNISAATRARVRETMERLGYVYHRGAASMRARSTRSVGVITPDSSNLFMGQFISAIDLEMGRRGSVTLSCHSYEDADRQDSLIQALLERGVDALVVMPAVESDEQLTATLEGVDVPVVIGVRPMRDASFTLVTSDHRAGGALVARHLLEHGCRSLGYIGGPAELTLRHDRFVGIREEIAGRSITFDLDVPTELTGVAGREAMLDIVRRGDLPDALICHNDSVAFGVFRAVRDTVPELLPRLRVVGFDGLVEAELWEPPLTTVSVDAQELGRQTAKLLGRKLAGDEVESVVLSPYLTLRSSCGEHPQTAGTTGEEEPGVSRQGQERKPGTSRNAHPTSMESRT